MSDEHVLDNKLQILGKLAASLIHEIRNPLSVIKLNVDYLILMRDQLSDETNECIASCKEASDRLLFLVENFSDFSKKHNLSTDVCSINDITQIAVNIMQVNASRLNLYIESELDPSIPSIYFQKDKLLQVFLNLINNAIESNNKTPKIYVRTYYKPSNNGKQIVWEVEDSGMGISEESKGKIFTDFYTSKKRGTGLGLSVCKSILQEYNASIEFESTEGVGTKFNVIFNPSSIRENNAK